MWKVNLILLYVTLENTNRSCITVFQKWQNSNVCFFLHHVTFDINHKTEKNKCYGCSQDVLWFNGQKYSSILCQLLVLFIWLYETCRTCWKVGIEILRYFQDVRNKMFRNKKKGQTNIQRSKNKLREGMSAIQKALYRLLTLKSTWIECKVW